MASGVDGGLGQDLTGCEGRGGRSGIERDLFSPSAWSSNVQHLAGERPVAEAPGKRRARQGVEVGIRFKPEPLQSC